MEVPELDEVNKTENHITSAAAFVEGGIQEACEDACSICLEAFCQSDPSTATGCRHEFHLQCILEWCQRSSHCPMCWQPVSLKDPSSQELLEAVERERNFRFNPPRRSAIFHHPTLGDFELQHVPIGANDAELEERILQHLAAAAAMGRAHHLARRDSRIRSSAHGRPQLMVLSTQPNAPPADETPSNMLQFPAGQADPITRSLVIPTNQHEISASNRTSVNQPSLGNQERAGPSELQSFSDSLKSRLNSVSMRYKESISKSTRGWKEKLFSRSTSVADLGCEVRREVNAGIASVSRMMERLETRERSRAGGASDSHDLGGSSVSELSSQGIAESRHENQPSGSNPAAFGPSSTLK